MNGRQFIPLVSAAAMALALSTPFALAADAEDTSAGVKEVRPVYPTSMESMIERRRDQLERRREHYRDARTGRRWYQSPWENAQDDWMDRTEDVMNERFRNRRDATEAQRDARGRWSNPRSQWRRDCNDAHRNAREWDQLNRDEYYDKRFYGGSRGGYRPYW